MKKNLLVPVVFSMLLLFGLFTGSAFAGALSISIAEEPNSLDPHETIMGGAVVVMFNIYDRLTYIDQDGLPQGWLAESWEVSDDGKEISFKIREGIDFHDGTPLNAEAVAFTFNRLIDPEQGAPARAHIGPLKRVEAISDYEVVFYYDAPYAPVFSQLGSPYMGIVSPAAVEKYGENYSRNPVGSGPLKMGEWRPGSEIILERNDDYQTWRSDIENQGPLNFPRMRINFISEPGTQMAALRTGEVHVVTNAPMEYMSRFEDNPYLELMTDKEGTNINLLEFNTHKPPFDDVRMRQVIGYAVNIEEIILGALSGNATPNRNPLPVGVPGYDPSIGEEYGYHHNPERARSLMEEMGYTKTPQGYVNQDGELLEIIMWVPSTNTATRSAEIIVYQLQQIGINVKMEVYETGTLIPGLSRGEHNMNIIAWSFWDASLMSMQLSSPGWVQMYGNPEIDEILEQTDVTIDPAERMEVIAKAQKALLEDAAIIPLFTAWGSVAHRSEVEGLKNDVVGILYNDVIIND